MKETLEYTGQIQDLTTPDNREVLEHGTADYAMSVHRTAMETKAGPALYYHWHEELEILFLVKGRMRMTVGSEEAWIESGQAVVILPGVPHASYCREPQHLEFYAVLVHQKFLASQEPDRIQTQYIMPVFYGWRNTPLTIDSGHPYYKEIVCNMKQICNFYQEEPRAFELMVKGCLYQIFYYLFHDGEETAAGQNSYTIPWVRNFLEYIRVYYAQRITLEELAGQVPMSSAYFCRSVKKVFGISPMDVLRNYRISQAVRMMENTEMSISDIAYSCGFNSINRFTEAFKRTQQCTPREYRRDIRDKRISYKMR